MLTVCDKLNVHEDGTMAARQIDTLIVGLGATGLAVARHLAALGERLLVIDSRAAPPALAALKRGVPAARVETGSLDTRWLEGVERVVVSPGLGVDIPIVREAIARGLPVLGDIELFARAVSRPVLAVTGSNGKSTVATLTARMLEAAGLVAPAGGNLGPPALDLLALERADAYVLEISSFQMETTDSLHPVAAALLNIAPDHLDRHGNLERYAALKTKLIAAADIAVCNADDPLVMAAASVHPAVVPFSVSRSLARGWSLIEHQSATWLARDGQPLLPAGRLKLRGTHNHANALAALALVDALDRELGGRIQRALAAVLDALAEFAGLPHRCEWVASRRGVRFLNDSKGTNVGATVAALEGLGGQLVLIAGGLGKGADFAPLARAARGRVKAAVLIGASADELERVLAPVCPVRRADDMRAAVATAMELASTGDTVLLSPACASQDMFSDYRHRGEAFASAVRELIA
jgi:UDP-N-acetylmuramoylalanine--D-glutamate ligase